MDMFRHFNLKKILSLASGIAIVVIILGYGIWISRDLLFGIRFSINGLTDGMSTNQGILTFSGTANHASLLVIDGETIPLAENGTWTDTLAVLPGYNTIQLQVTDRFKRTTEKVYRIYYKQ